MNATDLFLNGIKTNTITSSKPQITFTDLQ